MDKNSLAHTTWNCKYHIVFAPKYRRQIINIWEAESGYREDIADAMRAQGSDNPRGIGVSRSYPHVSEYTTEDQRIGIFGISEREKLPNDIRPICEFEVPIEVPIWESEILVSGLLCGYSGPKQEGNRGVYPESAERGQGV